MTEKVKKLMRYWALAWFLCLLASSSLAGSGTVVPVSVSDALKGGLGHSMVYLEDTESTFSLEDVLNLPPAAWQAVAVETPNFGYTESSYWFQLKLTNDRERPFSGVLNIEYALLDYIDFYWFEGSELVKEFRTGDRLPYTQRPLEVRSFLFPVEMQPGTVYSVVLRVRTDGSLQVPLALHDPLSFAIDQQQEHLFKSLYFGMMLIMAVYNLFLFVVIRDRSYLYYVGLVLSVVILLGGANGYLYQYLYPGSPTVQALVTLLSVPATLFFSCLFASRFLTLPAVAPRLEYALIGFRWVFGLSIIGAFFLPYSVSTRISVGMALPASLCILVSGAYAWYRGQQSARYFTFAWVFLLGGFLLAALSKLGLIPRTVLTETAINWGSAIEATLLSLALADRFNAEKQARFQAQKDRLFEVEQRKAAEEQLYYQATHHNIDGLPNATLLQKRLESLVSGSGETLKPFALILLQPSGLEDVANTLGHANADTVLSLLSKRLQRNPAIMQEVFEIEKGDDAVHYLAHPDRKTFALILGIESSEDATEFARKMTTVSSAPVEFGGLQLSLSLQAGVSLFPDHGNDPMTLLRHARVAVEHAQSNNLAYQLYHSRINPYSPRRLALMGELRRAIDTTGLSLNYQPIVQVDGSVLMGSEALIRWNHASLGFIPPDEFIPIAEKTGLIQGLTQWVLTRALEDYARWSRQYPDCGCLSVNISAINLSEPFFVTEVMDLLKRSGVNPADLMLEITETAVMRNPDLAMATLRLLSEQGVRIAVDDFGVGQTSLSYLRQLPVDEIKIDKSFVLAMSNSSSDGLIVKTTTSLSHDLGYRVVAEGVEDGEVQQALARCGCDYVQGYHIARPMSPEAYHEWLKEFFRSQGGNGRKQGLKG